MLIELCLPQIIGSFSQTYCFPRAIAYLDSGKVNVKGMVSSCFGFGFGFGFGWDLSVSICSP